MDLNPVRAGIVTHPQNYRWSSYRALLGLVGKPGGLDSATVYGQIAAGSDPARAAAKYAAFVARVRGVKLWDEHLNQQIYRGGGDFITGMQKLAGLDDIDLARSGAGHHNVSEVHLSAPPRDSGLHTYAQRASANKIERNQNISDAFHQGGHSQIAIALAFGVSSSTVSRVVMSLGKGA